MDPLSVTASIIAILQLSMKVLEYLNHVKDASKDRAQCEIETSNLYSLLVNLKCRLEEGSANQPWYTAVRALAVPNGPLDQFKDALEALQAKMTDGGRLKKAGKALMWKFRKEEVASILDQMERLKGLVGIALEMDHFKLSQAIKDDATFLRAQVPVIQSGVDAIRQQHDSAKHRSLLEWTSASDYPAQQSDIIRRREQGTGQWFMDAPEVSRWLNEPKATLFCPGIPGAGKTMMAAIAIDHLLNTMQHSTHGVAYVYCNYKAQKKQDVCTMLTAIMKQLVLGRPSAIEHIDRLHQNHAERGTKPSLDEITNVLRDVLAQYPYVYVVIDALDECQIATRRQFLAKLKDLQAGRDVRLMVTARFIPDIEDAFRAALKLEVRASRDDVKRFIAGQTYRLPTCIQRSAALQDIVQEKILNAVDGMFLLARLHVDSLQDKQTTKAVKTSLAKLTKGAAALDVAYAEAIQRIEGQLEGHRELARRVLLWITFAKRPLTTTEICCALAVEPDETEIDPDNVPCSEDIVCVCAGLVVVDQESALIRLVHYTTQEFFERTGNAWVPDSQLHIARTCLTYLCFDAFQSGSCTADKEYEKRLQEHQFLEYAAKYWGEHVRAVEDDIAGQVCTFLNSTSLSCAVQVLRVPVYKYRRYSEVYPTTTPLHELAHFGLATIARQLASAASGLLMRVVNARNSRGDTPLSMAAVQGHCETVNVLLDNEADLNAQGGHYGNALQAASYGGHEAVVKMLLNKGADVNAQGGEYGNALQAASARGHEAVVKMLLDKGADVNAQGGEYGSALQAALASGHEAVVKMLLAKGADVNAQGGEYGNALQEALYEGHEAVVKMLVAWGARSS
ncbi:ankyrin repeat domain containing protein [Pyrenophora tritici-repentis]|nr:ankyrin repeat domain containing protein [Pyrenophora tritici-repentis]